MWFEICVDIISIQMRIYIYINVLPSILLVREMSVIVKTPGLQLTTYFSTDGII